MPINPPVVTELAGGDSLRDSSRVRLNTNQRNLKTAIDAIIEAINSGGVTGGAPVYQLWNGTAYPARPSLSAVPNGMVVRVGPVPPEDSASRDTWNETDD